MTKMTSIDVELPTDEELEEKFTAEELEEFQKEFDNIETMDDLLAILRKMGASVEEVDYDELDEELAGPNDTIH